MSKLEPKLTGCKTDCKDLLVKKNWLFLQRFVSLRRAFLSEGKTAYLTRPSPFRFLEVLDKGIDDFSFALFLGL